jgi:hypothetical protein
MTAGCGFVLVAGPLIGKIGRDFCKIQSSIYDSRLFLLLLVGQQKLYARFGVAEHNAPSIFC